jgi:hypothetical protein
MIHTAQQNGLISGLADHVIEGGCSILQYADDTILLIKDDVECARNLKLLLYTFESMSGLKINFEKSEVLLIQEDDKIMRRCCFMPIFSTVRLELGLSNTLVLLYVPEELQ